MKTLYHFVFRQLVNAIRRFACCPPHFLLLSLPKWCPLIPIFIIAIWLYCLVLWHRIDTGFSLWASLAIHVVQILSQVWLRWIPTKECFTHGWLFLAHINKLLSLLLSHEVADKLGCRRRKFSFNLLPIASFLALLDFYHAGALIWRLLRKLPSRP